MKKIKGSMQEVTEEPQGTGQSCKDMVCRQKKDDVKNVLEIWRYSFNPSRICKHVPTRPDTRMVGG